MGVFYYTVEKSRNGLFLSVQGLERKVPMRDANQQTIPEYGPALVAILLAYECIAALPLQAMAAACGCDLDALNARVNIAFNNGVIYLAVDGATWRQAMKDSDSECWVLSQEHPIPPSEQVWCGIFGNAEAAVRDTFRALANRLAQSVPCYEAQRSANEEYYENGGVSDAAHDLACQEIAVNEKLSA
jgi:hypothetical protein